MTFPGTVRRVQPQDLLPASRVSSVCFEYGLQAEGDADVFYQKQVEEAAKDQFRGSVHFMDKYVAEYNGEIIAALSDTIYPIAFDGHTMRMSGIGGVCTLPPYRRLGAVRAMMNRSLREHYEQGVEWSLLYPFSQSYYEKFGYALNEPDMTWSFSLRSVRPLANNPYSFTLHKGGHEGLEGFQEAYNRMTGYNLMVMREPCDFTRITAADPYAKNDYAYLCRDAGGAACGYIIWRKHRENEQRIMQITELIFDSLQALHGILDFAAGFASDYDRLSFKAPYTLNLEALCTDAVAGQLQRNAALCGMIRAVHAENALRGAKLRGTGETVLWINDPTLERQYQLGLRWRDGQLEDMGATKQAPDARLPVGLFSALLLGRYEPADFEYLTGAEFINPEKMTGLFYKKPIHTKNYF